MESSILSEVHNTSILRTGLSTDYAVISTSLAPQIVTGLRLRTRAAGWSGATSCIDVKRTNNGRLGNDRSLRHSHHEALSPFPQNC